MGVVVHAPAEGYLGARFTSKFRRVKDAFADLESSSLRQILGYLRDAFARKAEAIDDMVDERGNDQRSEISAIVRSVLPEDDSSLQWSQRRVGFAEADQLDATLDQVYERFVGRYEGQYSEHGRQDPDVWRICRPSFDASNATSKIVKHSFRSSIVDDEITFDHAWKNGQWNCFEPVSFDLKQADSIRNKAQRMNGKLNDLKGLENEITVSFLLAEPREPKLRKELQRAENRLTNTDFKVEIVRERELESWSREMAARIVAEGE